MSYVYIVNVTFCGIEDEAIIVGEVDGASSHLTVKGSYFWRRCTFEQTFPPQFQGSFTGLYFRPRYGNLSVSDTEFGGFEHHAVKVHSKDVFVTLVSVVVREIGPKSKIQDSLPLQTKNAAVRFSGSRLAVVVRDSEIYANSESGIACQGLHNSVVHLSNVKLHNNAKHGMEMDGAHDNTLNISRSTFESNEVSGCFLSGVGNHISTGGSDASQRSVFLKNQKTGLEITGWYNDVYLRYADVIGNGENGLSILGKSWTPTQGVREEQKNHTEVEIADVRYVFY